MADDGYGGAPIVQAAGSTDAYGGAPIVQPAPARNDPASNFWRDWKQRAAEGSAMTDAAVQDPAMQQPRFMGLPNANDLKLGAGLLTTATAPAMAAYDAVIGRPVAGVANVVNQATNIAPGYEANPHTISDVASFAFPLAEGVNAARTTAKAAQAAGLSQHAYEMAAAAGQRARAIAAAQAAATAKAAKPPGPIARAVQPFVAAVSPKAAEAQAAAQVTRGATDLPAVNTSLADSGELVPGSNPTLFQQTGDMGIGAMERDARTANPGAYQTRAAEQNAARVEALPSPDGDPAQVSQALKDHLDAVDAETQSMVDRATLNASGKTDAAGGVGTADETGNDLRETISSAEQAGRAKTSEMYTALGLDDPAVTGNVRVTKAAADDIEAGQAATARPPEGEEAAIYAAGRGMRDVAPVRDLLALRSRVAAELRNQRLPGGDPQAVRRLSQYQTAIDHNLDATIADKVTIDQSAVASGALAPSDSLAARVNSVIDERLAQQQPQALADRGGGVGAPARSGPAVDVGADGSALPPNGGLGGAPSGEGVPSGTGDPTVSPSVVPDLRAANAEYKAQRETFGVKPVAGILARAKSGGYAALGGEIPGRVFKPGPTGFETMRAAIKAGGDRAVQVLEDAAAQSLRKAAMRSDGTIDPDKFAKWQAAHSDALRALPDASKARFADAAEAGKAVDEATANRAAALKAENAGMLGKLINADPEEVAAKVGAIFNKPDSVTQMKALVARLKGNPEALKGLRQAVVDHITINYVGNTEAATSGVNQIKADAFQTFVRKNSGALRQVFSPEELSNVHAIAADINRAKRSENAIKLPGQSNSPQDLAPTLKDTIAKNAGRSILDAIGFALGAHFGGVEAGGPAGAVIAETVQALRNHGIANVQSLVNRALLDPAFARTLLAKAPVHRAGTTALDTGWVVRSKAIQRALAAGAITSETTDGQSAQPPSPSAPRGEDFSSTLKDVGKTYPRLQQYLGDVVVQRGATSDDRQLEYYAPNESDNPHPGKSTLEIYNPSLRGQDLTDSVGLDLLHHIGGVKPNGAPVDPAYYAMKQDMQRAIEAENRPMDKEAYAEDRRAYPDTGSYEQWLQNNRVDAYIRGIVSPRMNPEWAKPGIYTPRMKVVGAKIMRYLKGASQ